MRPSASATRAAAQVAFAAVSTAIAVSTALQTATAASSGAGIGLQASAALLATAALLAAAAAAVPAPAERSSGDASNPASETASGPAAVTSSRAARTPINSSTTRVAAIATPATTPTTPTEPATVPAAATGLSTMGNAGLHRPRALCAGARARVVTYGPERPGAAARMRLVAEQGLRWAHDRERCGSVCGRDALA